MRIGTLSKRTGASIRSIRHYDENGLLDANRAENGYREFDESAVGRVHRIKQLINYGLTLEEILPMTDCLNVPVSEEQFCGHLMEIYESKLRALDEEIEVLQQKRHRLAGRLRYLRERRGTAERMEARMEQ